MPMLYSLKLDLVIKRKSSTLLNALAPWITKDDRLGLLYFMHY